MILKDQNSALGFITSDSEDFSEAVWNWGPDQDILDIELRFLEEKSNEQ